MRWIEIKLKKKKEALSSKRVFLKGTYLKETYGVLGHLEEDRDCSVILLTLAFHNLHHYTFNKVMITFYCTI